MLCIPSKAIESWVAAAVLPEKHKLLSGIECNSNLAAQLSALPKQERIKKDLREYRNRAGELVRQWDRVVRTCTQAAQFASDVRAALDEKVTNVWPEPAAPLVTEVLHPAAMELSPHVPAFTDGVKPVALAAAIELMLAAEAAAAKAGQLVEPVIPKAEEPTAVPDPSDDPSTN